MTVAIFKNGSIFSPNCIISKDKSVSPEGYKKCAVFEIADNPTAEQIIGAQRGRSAQVIICFLVTKLTESSTPFSMRFLE